jgi:hypothetical protein
MRTLRLAKVVAQAEGMRLRAMAQRQIRRVVIAAVAGFFLTAFLVAGHIAIGMALVPTVTPLQAVLIVGGGDLLLALILGAVAASSKPGAIEREALELRQKARQEMQEALTVPAMMAGIARTVGVDSLIKLIFSVLRGRMFGRKRV